MTAEDRPERGGPAPGAAAGRAGAGTAADSLELLPLERGARRRAAAAVLTEAFLDDPVWVAIGPRARWARRRVLRGFFGLTLMEALRFGGPSWCATRHGRVLGVAVTFREGERFPPPHAAVVESPPLFLAGPGPTLRGARVGAVMEHAHPREPHLYLWFLAAHPSAQRTGVGRALMAKVLEEADLHELPAYLETTRAENVPYYRSFGFRESGDEELPRGAHMWFMSRDGAGGSIILGSP